MGDRPPLRPVVYLVRGPDGVYVGLTANPRLRWTQHRLPCHRRATVVRKGRAVRRRLLPLYASMRRHGLRRFRFEVVATCVEPCGRGAWSRAGEELEAEVVACLRAAGERVFNAERWRGPVRA